MSQSLVSVTVSHLKGHFEHFSNSHKEKPCSKRLNTLHIGSYTRETLYCLGIE